MICQCVYVHFELDNTYTTILKIKTIVKKLTYVWANGEVDGRMERQMDEWRGRWTNGEVDGRTERQMDEWRGRCTNGQVDERMDRQMNEWTVRWTGR